MPGVYIALVFAHRTIGHQYVGFAAITEEHAPYIPYYSLPTLPHATELRPAGYGITVQL
jgi:hypothetical protein